MPMHASRLRVRPLAVFAGAFLSASLLLGVFARPALAEVGSSRFGAGGYFRLMTRPDFQGGDSRLGYWNLYGRLLNEGVWASLELRLDIVPEQPGTAEPWTSVQARIEGGSVANAHPALGRLDQFALTQLYALAGNVLLENVTFRLGTLEWYWGDLSLYDMRPAQLFFQTLGLSALAVLDEIEVLVGVGDAGYFIRRDQYNTIFTVGGGVRLKPNDHFVIGVGGEAFVEPKVAGNRFAPHATPDVGYDDFVRGEVAERFLEENPGQEEFFDQPVARSSFSYKVIGQIGFGGLGPLVWNNLFANYTKRHPDNFVIEQLGADEYTIYTHDLTDERAEINIGNEMQLRLVPGVLDALFAGLLGIHTDGDNDVAPTDFDRTFWSTVLRLQLYLTETLHLLAETSYAQEKSRNGNAYRLHADSVFRSEDGVGQADGLELGDTDTRKTWQGKIGLVLSPTGTGIFSRPSLRLLYGIQHSNQNNAFGNSFNQNLDELDPFGIPEQHVHHVVSLEAEAWF